MPQSDYVPTAVTTVDACRTVLHAAFPDLRVERVRFLAEGWDSAVFEIDGGLVFRFPKRDAVDQTIQKEIRLLPELAPFLPPPIPAFTHVSGPVPGHPWHVVGYRKLPGSPLPEIDLTPDLIAAIAPPLAAFLTALHGFPVSRARALGVPTFSPDQWLVRHRDLVGAARDIVRPHLDPGTISRFGAFWDSVFADPASTRYTPTLIHGDLNAEHVLIADGEVSGVIDFGDTMIADPALDLAGFPDPLARAIIERVGPRADSGLWHRRTTYIHAVPLHALTAGTELDRPDLIQDGLRCIRRLFG